MKRLLPFVVLILLLLAGFLSLPFLLNPEKHHKEIVDKISQLLNRPVVMGPMTMGYFPPTLRVTQAAVMSPTGSPLLQVQTVNVPLDWKALFKLKLSPMEVELVQWNLTISRQQDGRWDIENILSETTGLSGAKTWSLRQLRWKEGEIHWVDSFSAVPQEVILTQIQGHWDPRPETLDTQGTFSGMASGVTVNFSGKGQFFAAPQWTGDLQITDQGNSGAFHLSRVASVIELKGQSPKWNLSNALFFLRFYARSAPPVQDLAGANALENWQFQAKIQKSILFFEHSAVIAGGISEAKGTVVFTPNGIVLKAEAAAKSVPVEAILALTGSSFPLSGQATLVVKGLEVFLSKAPLSTLGGIGYIEIREGAYRLPEVSLKKLAKAKSMGYLRKKFPDLAIKGIPYSKLSARWTAKGGMATVDDGLLVSTDMKASWTGKIDLGREGLDGFCRVQFSEKEAGKRNLIPVKYHTQPAFGRLTGTAQEWMLRAVPKSKIPLATHRKLQQAILGK